MNTEKLMNAVGGISGKYVTEFAEIKPVKKPRAMILKAAAGAACLCFAVICTLLLAKNSERQGAGANAGSPQGNGSGIAMTQGNETDAERQGETVWADGTDQMWGNYDDQVSKGSIVIADSLKIMMDWSDNEEDVFAVWIRDMEGASDKEIYDAFVKPLGVEEEYEEKGLIYATKEQINSFVCPPEFALVLYLGAMPYEEIPVDEEYLETVEYERIRVMVCLRETATALAEYEERLRALRELDSDNERFDEMQAQLMSAIKAEGINVVTAIMNDYGISDEEVNCIGIFYPRFGAELEPQTIAKLLTDERVGYIYVDVDYPGFDQ